MPSNHPPPRAQVDLQRRRAKRLLRAYRAGDAEAHARVMEALGRPQMRFVLADAQHVIAVEQGFSRWDAYLHSMHGPVRPLARLGIVDIDRYEAAAERLLHAYNEGDAEAMARVAVVFADGAVLGLREARLVIAREYGHGSWQELSERTRSAQATPQEQPSRLVAEAMRLMSAGDADALADLLSQRPDLVRAKALNGHALLEMAMLPDVFPPPAPGRLAVDRTCVKSLIRAGSELVPALYVAARFDQAEGIELLLAADAPLNVLDQHGLTPLATAVCSGAARAGDMLARHGVLPNALWVAAGAGRLDVVQWFFAADGALLPAAYQHRPNYARLGWPSVDVPDAPSAVLGEAFIFACFNGRCDVAQRLLELGADVDSRPYLNLTGLQFAVEGGHRAMVEWLLAQGADRGLRGALRGETATDRARRVAPDLVELLEVAG